MSSEFKYDSYGNSIDGTDYCSGIETFAQNLIEDNEGDASVAYPSKTAWMTPRSKEFRMTSDNTCLIVDKDIYKIKKVYLRGYPYIVSNGTTTHLSWNDIKDVNGNIIDEYSALDISPWVVAEEVYNALRTPGNLSDAMSESPNTCNTFYYSKNSIYFGKNVAIKYGSDYTSTYILTEIVRTFYSTKYYYNGKKLSETANAGIAIYGGGYPNPNFYKELQFRVEYIPMSSDIKLRARKSVKQQEEYIQILNQRAEINSASALGKFMYNTAQKMGTEQITLVKFYTKIGDIPPLGCRVKHNGQHYILTANSIEMTNCVQVKVTHTLSKNWSNKSQYVSVDQKYRNYKIPADILWRNMHWEDYIEITTDGVVENAEAGDLLMSVIDDSTTKRAIIPRIFICDKTDDVTITSFFLYRANRESYDWGVTVPCTTIGMANSMVFSASMKDNLSAGLRISEENNQYCEEVFYCEENGKLDYARAVLSGGINITDAGAYPQATLTRNTPTDKVFDEIFYISKDPGEALKFTYQCHWISADNDIVIGSKLAENHPLVKKWTENRKFRFLALRKPLRQGEDKVRPEEHMDILILTDEQRKGYFGMQDLISDTQKAFKLMLVGAGLSLLNNAGVKAWAITDENYNLYIGCNDKSKTTLYFSHIHERI